MKLETERLKAILKVILPCRGDYPAARERLETVTEQIFRGFPDFGRNQYVILCETRDGLHVLIHDNAKDNRWNDEFNPQVGDKLMLLDPDKNLCKRFSIYYDSDSTSSGSFRGDLELQVMPKNTVKIMAIQRFNFE